MREILVNASVLALRMGRVRSPVGTVPLAFQQDVLPAVHFDEGAGNAAQAVQEVLNPGAGFADDVVHDDQGAFPRGLCNGGVEGLDEGEPGFPDGVQGVFMPSPGSWPDNRPWKKSWSPPP